VYLEGGYSNKRPELTQDLTGLLTLCQKFSFPGGFGSHCTPELPGSINEGGELGYSLAHGFGAAFDHPNLIVSVVIGDGEAETGALATAWHSNKFLNPITDGAVLPILHLNGYKINNPSLLARISPAELKALLFGYGYAPLWVSGEQPELMHAQMAAALDSAIHMIKKAQQRARQHKSTLRPLWPMLVLKSPKGWTGPQEFNGKKIANFWRAHQVPITVDPTNPAPALEAIENWLLSYRPQELFTPAGSLKSELTAFLPPSHKRMSNQEVANGGYPMNRKLKLPDYRQFGVQNVVPGVTRAENTVPLGEFLAAIIQANPHTFRAFGPDETTSNKLHAMYQVTGKCFWGEILPIDADGSMLSRDGRIMEMLSEHTLEGWLEGYTLTGRHGILATYEAFAHVIDSMINQHCKWLAMLKQEAWRKPVPSLNLLLTSTVWRQDHNGFTHQAPGFVDLLANNNPSVSRIYYPPDANTLLAMAEHCFNSQNYVNVLVIDKQQHLQFVPIAEASNYCANGINIWPWASDSGTPDVIIASCGDIVTIEALAACQLVRQYLPETRIRMVNVIDLFRLPLPSTHPHGLTDHDFFQIFSADKPIIFNFHGYPSLIKQLIAERHNNLNFDVHGYQEHGSIATPLELAISNRIDRFSLAISAINRLTPQTQQQTQANQQALTELTQLRASFITYAHTHGVDPSEISHWQYAP
jgi:xylulose-5-phosphate/fructose-6-phosphate phosphoketolase